MCQYIITNNYTKPRCILYTRRSCLYDINIDDYKKCECNKTMIALITITPEAGWSVDEDHKE